MQNSNDSLSAELRRIAERCGPRFDPQYWTCPSCHCGATRIQPWDRVWWAFCDLCRTRGAVGEDVFDPPLSGDEDGRPVPIEDRIELPPGVHDEIMYAWVLEMASFHQPEGAHPMFRKKVNPNDPNADLDNALFNPWAGMLQGRKSNDPDDPSALPIGWDRLSQASAERVGLALVESDPDLGGLAVLGPWRRLRARHLLPEHQGESGAIAEALRPYYLSDPVERAKWRKAEAEIAAVGPFLLPNALRKLKASGDMLCSLRARRDELNVQIERLERRLGLATTDGAGARQ